jgi:hypothetical protein
MRQKIYFDTDIVNNIADEHGEFRNKWPKVRALVEKAYSYRISFVTWKELVCRLARGDESYFKSHQAALRILHEPKPRIFMEYPPLFRIETSTRDCGSEGQPTQGRLSAMVQTMHYCNPESSLKNAS